MVVGIVVGAASLAMILLIMMISRRKKKDREQEIKAAAMLLKERQLRNAIDMNKKNGAQREQLILVVSWKDDKKRKFIFDPATGVRIGRGRDENQICVPLDTVSQKHCMIFSNDGYLYVKDLNSANGTYIKRGLKKYLVRDCQLCRDNDSIIVGGIAFKIRSFWIDSAYI